MTEEADYGYHEDTCDSDCVRVRRLAVTQFKKNIFTAYMSIFRQSIRAFVEFGLILLLYYSWHLG